MQLPLVPLVCATVGVALACAPATSSQRERLVATAPCCSAPHDMVFLPLKQEEPTEIALTRETPVFAFL
jgi:hypothetical protein